MNDLEEFVQYLVALNGTMKELFTSGNTELFTEMNKTIKQMHRIQSVSKTAALMAIEPECKMIYANFDMIIKVLRTTEDGVIDAGAQSALNKFLHNIDEAVVNIAKAFGLVS